MPVRTEPQLKTKERRHSTIRETHTIVVHVTRTGLYDFHHDSLPVAIPTGDRNNDAVTQLESRLTWLEGATTQKANPLLEMFAMYVPATRRVWSHLSSVSSSSE